MSLFGGSIHSFIGTSLQGYLRLPSGEGVPYATLVAELGEPGPGDGEGGKTQAEWGFDTPLGFVTVYDYKQYDIPVEQVTDWHVGGHNLESVADWATSHGWLLNR